MSYFTLSVEQTYRHNAPQQVKQSTRTSLITLAGFITFCLLPMNAYALFNQFEVGTGDIHSTLVAANNSYDQFAFTSPFENPPAVFALPSTRGGDSCIVRFDNINENGFEAVCAEDSAYDGEHTNLAIQYIAISEGVQVIPSNAGTASDVTFEVGCVDTDAVVHNCTTGCPTESSVPITFSSALTNPVVLTSIQTSNNQTLGAPPTNPIQPMLSPVVDNLTSVGFDLSLDFNKEDDIASIVPERVCWLAVEQVSRCDLAGTDSTLNFSNIGGPGSVAFESIITPTNIDGWDNNCNNTEEATFTPGCFTNTPVAVASLRSRNAAEGEDEGWLRYCTLNSGELRLTIDEQTRTRDHVDEQASVLAFGSSFSTPVTLARFRSERTIGRKISFEWETESESFNVGFNLWAEVAGEWQQINPGLISSNAIGLQSAEFYEKTIRLNKSISDEVEAVGISTVDNSGYEEFFGPFELGEVYGEHSELAPIDWTAVRAEYEQNMLDAGFVKLGKRWKKSNINREKRATRKNFQLNRQVVELEFDQQGIYKVGFEELTLEASKFAGISLDRIALTHNGVAVPRVIESDNDTFDAGDQIVFYVGAMSPTNALYDYHSIYRLEVNASKAITAAPLASVALKPTSTSSDNHLQSIILNEQNLYSPTSTSGDPWFMDSIRSIGSPGIKDYIVELPALAQSDQAPELIVLISGGLNFPGVASEAPDHHVQISLNGNLLSSTRFDGFTSQRITTAIDPQLLVTGSNTIRLMLPGDTGQFADLIMVDSVTLKVPKTNTATTQALVINAQTDVNRYLIASAVALNNATVYATQPNGNFAPLQESMLDDDVFQFGALLDQDQLQGLQYWVVGDSAYMHPLDSRMVQPRNLMSEIQQSKADYLIVAHPSFINSTLDEFVSAKRASGHKPIVISWLDIVDSYGYGVNSPFALTTMLSKLGSKTPLKNLLLVGGHSYDYNDHLGNENVNFIPAYYQKVSKFFEYAPSDNGFADIDADGLPEIAIGRWPVRSEQDLQRIVSKTIKWEQNSDSYKHRSLLVSDVSDNARGQQFSNQLEDIAPLLSKNINSLDVTRIYLDNYIEQNLSDPDQQAKADLLSEFSATSAGFGVMMYNGHGSTSRWTFRNLFNASDAANMSNSETPTVVMPLACYTTYYEEPSNNSLAHQLLFGSNGGAVAISGAAYLSDYRENALFAKKVLRTKNAHNLSWGQAILRVKRTMVEWNDAVTNWSYLGDPSIK